MATALETVEEQTRRAWADYAHALAGLDGAAYDAAEQEAWAQLQEALASVDPSDAPPGAPSVG